MMNRVMIRGWIGHRQVFQEFTSVDDAEIDTIVPALGEKHAKLMKGSPHMIEIEFLDEMNPKERFYRFGTDPTRMVKPRAIKL